MFNLKPSEIRFCQNSIKSTFDNGQNIGKVLDDICEGRTPASSFPVMRVTKHGGYWMTSDNRRLWLFRHLERLGKCGQVPVTESSSIPDRKMTTNNNGVSIDVRGSVWGNWWCKPSCPNPGPPYFCSFEGARIHTYSSRRHMFDDFELSDDDDDFDYDYDDFDYDSDY